MDTAYAWEHWWLVPEWAWFRDGEVPERPRDSQRTRVYRADDVLMKAFPQRIETIPEIQAYVDTLVREPWWRTRSPVNAVEVHDGRGRRSAAAWKPARRIGAITMPKWFRTESIILHELAHVMSASLIHGPKYCAALLDLIRYRMGDDAHDTLRDAYDLHRARYEPWYEPDPPPRATSVIEVKTASEPDAEPERDGVQFLLF